MKTNEMVNGAPELPVLTGGPLFALYQTSTEYFLHHIDPQIHVDAYVGTHELEFAETEFAGKYLDTCVRYAAETGSAEALQHAELVVASIIKNQRQDGYIGGLPEGQELEWFGVWNQAFTMVGLLSYYDLTKDASALRAAERIGDYASGRFLYGADINSGINDGSQHLSILLPMVRLYQRTRKPLHRDFVLHIIDKIQNSDNNFFAFDSILDLRSKKGIENFVILLGLLEYGAEFGDDSAVDACKRYWDELNETQIRSNGNGTLVEFWTKGGNVPRILKAEDKPDENCVAVGWMEFSTALFLLTREAKYLHALEKSLFNHLLGAADSDCKDFGYYQPNYGKRVVKTASNFYKCCRYRGYSMISQLPHLLFWADRGRFIPMVYSGAHYEDQLWRVEEQTDYPVAGDVLFSIQVNQPCKREMRLRIPVNCQGYRVTVDGKPVQVPAENDYICIPCDWVDGSHTIQLTLDISFIKEYGVIDGVKHLSCRHGCVLLAAEVEDMELESLMVQDTAVPKRISPTGGARVEYRLGGTRIIDYAAAGRDENHSFTVWMRCNEG